MAAKDLSEKEIESTYNLIKKYHKKFLAKHGIALPKLLNSKNEYTKNALVLIYLAHGYPNTTSASKKDITAFIRKYYPDVPDVQQPRHLGAQEGWFIQSKRRGAKDIDGEYKLISLEQPYPFFHDHRVADDSNWDELKKSYGFRCATCGSLEGEPNLHWPDTTTQLQAGHMDPHKGLVKGNIIPQCQLCNRGDRNNWVYDERGRVIKVANPNVILRSSARTQQEMYKILYKKYGGEKPEET